MRLDWIWGDHKSNMTRVPIRRETFGPRDAWRDMMAEAGMGAVLLKDKDHQGW